MCLSTLLSYQLILCLQPNIFPLLGGFFVNNVVCQSNHFCHTTKQNVMKKAKYLIYDRLEKVYFEKW